MTGVTFRLVRALVRYIPPGQRIGTSRDVIVGRVAIVRHAYDAPIGARDVRPGQSAGT